MAKDNRNNDQLQAIEDEAAFGTVPVVTREKQYRFSDAFFFMGSYAIATWNYTQGAYISSLVGFKQMLVVTIFGMLFLLLFSQLPVILSTRYGIDIWVWLRGALGKNGVRVATVLMVLFNFPWHAIVSELFASSMENLLGLAGITLPEFCHPLLGIACMVIGAFIAFKGIHALNIATKFITPLLLVVGFVVIIVGFTSAPPEVIWNFVPPAVREGDMTAQIGYILAMDAMFAFNLSWWPGMGGIPRLTKTERKGFWANILGSGFVGSFYVIIGAVMAISMHYVTGEMETDPTIMLATLAFPALALLSLLLVGFANIGTQASATYLYAVLLKSAFPKANYRVMVWILCVYICILTVWGKILEYFGVVLTVGACLYGPLAALLLTDFFIVRRQKISLRAAFSIGGNTTYDYFHGFNPVGILCVAAGFATSLLIVNPITLEVHIPFLFHLTPSLCACAVTALLYLAANCIPAVRKYNLRDRSEITV